MAAIDIICGAECGTNFDEGSASPLRHWQDINGTANIETSIVRSGTKSYRFVGASQNLNRSVKAASTVGYGHMFFRVTNAAPASNEQIWQLANGVHTASMRITTAGVLQVLFGGGTAQSGPTVSTGQFYGVEFEIDVSAATILLHWRTWDATNGWVRRTDATQTGGPSTHTDWSLGTFSTWAGGDTLYLDDIILGSGTTPGELWDSVNPRGCQVLRYLPNADGTHAFNLNDFDNTGTGLNPSSTVIYQILDEDDQDTTTDYVTQAVAGAGKYIRIQFADEATLTAPRAVCIVSRHTSSGAGTNEHHMRASADGSTWTNLWGDWSATGDDIGGTGSQSRSAVMDTAPGGVPWTQALINSLEIEWGNSDDVAPLPRIHSVSAEVAWEEVPARDGDILLQEPSPAFGFRREGSLWVETITADSPVLWFRLGESAGPTANNEVGGTDGTFGGDAPTFGVASNTGDGNTAIQFVRSATSTFINVPDHAALDFGDVFSLEMWLKRNGTGQTNVLMFKAATGGTGFAIIIGASNSIQFTNPGVTITLANTNAYADTVQWHHIVCTKNGSTSKIYVDGLDVGTPGTNYTVTDTTSDFGIGASSANGIDGIVDEALVYNVALSASQVLAHYLAASTWHGVLLREAVAAALDENFPYIGGGYYPA